MTEIKKATPADLDHLVSLFDGYRVFYRKESDELGAASFLKERLTQKDSHIFMAIVDGVAVGFTQLFPSFSSTKMQRLWILNDLFVNPDYRGKGISKELIAVAKEFCKETDGCGILLETEASNAIGNQLYPATGFKLEENNFYYWAK